MLTGNGTGTITGITPGPGLVGGGSSGNVSLSLPITCPNLSVLQWTGSKWACSSAGSGTINGVTAGTDLTGGGTGGNVMLNLDTTKVPQLNAANTFTGNQSVTGNLTVTGVLNGQTGSFSGSSSFGTSILKVVQKGSATAISGFASGTTGVNFGVTGLSSSNSGVGVSGEGGTGVSGIGYAVGGSFQLGSSTGYILQGKNSSGTTLFYVDSSGNQSTGGNLFANGYITANGPMTASGNGQFAIMGDPGCGAGYAGIGFGSLSGCTNYSMIGDGKDTFFNRPSGGYLHFRENNGGSNGADDQMVVTPGGAVGIGTSSPNAQLDVRGGAGNSGFGISTDSNAWQARSAGGFVKAMAYIDPFAPGGIAVVHCYNSQMAGAAVTTPPCGIAINHYYKGTNILDFGFQVSDRFIQITPQMTTATFETENSPWVLGAYSCVGALPCAAGQGGGNRVVVVTVNTADTSNTSPIDAPFFIFVY